MKSLYLIRHAIAADPSPAYATDAIRPLTEEGIERWRQHVRALRTLDVDVELILTSPYARCRQTAELLAEGLPGVPPVIVFDALRPGGPIAGVIDGTGDHRRFTALALVGHEPSIGSLAAQLMGAQGSVPFKKGAVCRIDVEAFPPRGEGQLVWFLPPRVLRRLGA
jgi:phosphohistidine phosphatase